jgi:hypothetical protein
MKIIQKGEKQCTIAGLAAARLFFLTVVAIAIATRPFKFHKISVSNTSSSFVSSIHSLAKNAVTGHIALTIEVQTIFFNIQSLMY